jgi:hypothetical protein
MVIWIFYFLFFLAQIEHLDYFQKPPLGGRPQCLTQNRETMTLQTLTTVGLFDFIMCENPHE